MKKIEIPHFKEIILMSTNCGSCGYKDNEVKSAAAISPLGTKLILKVTDKEDLARDILKSETAELTIPEIDLHLNPGTLGGRFTTLEGLLKQVFEELDQKVFARGDSAAGQPASQNPPESGDSDEAQNYSKTTMEIFLDKFKKVGA
jgi:zinc finger protein